MKIISTILLFLFFLTFAEAQNYKQVKIYLNEPSNVQQLINQGLQIDHFVLTKDNSMEVFVNEQDLEILQNSGYRFDILIDDWYKYYESLPQLSDAEKQSFIAESKMNFNVGGFGFGSMGGHLTYAEMVLELDSMYMLYPNLITQKMQIGTSIEGRAIWAVKISDNPNLNENEPRVAFTGLTHAREPMGMMNLIYYMYYLLENYGTDAEATYLVNNREIFFIPVVNPDGYEFNRSTNPNGGGLWRKNRRNNTGSYGVDLNRNFGPYAYWNAPNGGSSTTPSSDTYRGTAPFSEPETQVLRDYFANKNIKAILNYHTYGNYLIYPYGALVSETPDSLIYREYAAEMTKYNLFTYGTDMQTVSYSTRGNSDDYLYDGDTVLNGGNIFAMTPEVGTSSDGFWAPQSRIFPLAQECLWMNKYITWAAGDFPALQDPGYNKPYFIPGDTIAIQPFYFNKGQSTSQPVNIQLTSLSTYATVFADIIPLDTIPPRSSVQTFMPFGVFLSSTTPIEEEVKFVMAVRSGINVIRKDTISFIVGMPNYVLADTSNIINTMWTITASPSTPKWETTTSTFKSAPNSYTDSPTGNYANNATVTMTLTNAIDLSIHQHPRLIYWTKYDLEPGYDYGQVEISTNNGSSWIPMAGQYTIIGSGSFQPNGQPLYNGIRSGWVREEINLSNYNSSQFKVRFKLRSDVSLQKDGWYLDDISILTYTAVPVELTSFSAQNNSGVVVLNWATSSELNNSGFSIERVQANSKGTAGAAYNVLGFVNGNGTTENKNSYRFVDDSPLKGKSFYRLKQYDLNGAYRIYGPVQVEISPVYSFGLEQNYPNPFNPSTTINYSIAENAFVTIEIYNIIGQQIASLVNAKQEAGEYSVVFDAADYSLSNGVYIYKLKAGNFTLNRKMILMK